MQKVYLLQHSYEYEIEENLKVDETKIIGIYSSYEMAEQVKERYKTKKGFSRFPIDCFYIDEYELDNDNWKEGFITWDSSSQSWIE